MERRPIVSSVIDEVGYNAPTRTLEILFKTGAMYLYYFVPQDVHDALINADSKGTYYERQIKGIYEHHRIWEPYGPIPRRSRLRKPKLKK